MKWVIPATLVGHELSREVGTADCWLCTVLTLLQPCSFYALQDSVLVVGPLGDIIQYPVPPETILITEVGCPHPSHDTWKLAGTVCFGQLLLRADHQTPAARLPCGVACHLPPALLQLG